MHAVVTLFLPVFHFIGGQFLLGLNEAVAQHHGRTDGSACVAAIKQRLQCSRGPTPRRANRFQKKAPIKRVQFCLDTASTAELDVGGSRKCSAAVYFALDELALLNRHFSRKMSETVLGGW